MIILMRSYNTIIIIQLLAWHSEFEKRKTLKKEFNEELMPVLWHPKRWWESYFPEDQKIEIEPIFPE